MCARAACARRPREPSRSRGRASAPQRPRPQYRSSPTSTTRSRSRSKRRGDGVVRWVGRDGAGVVGGGGACYPPAPRRGGTRGERVSARFPSPRKRMPTMSECNLRRRAALTVAAAPQADPPMHASGEHNQRYYMYVESSNPNYPDKGSQLRRCRSPGAWARWAFTTTCTARTWARWSSRRRRMAWTGRRSGQNRASKATAGRTRP